MTDSPVPLQRIMPGLWVRPEEVVSVAATAFTGNADLNHKPRVIVTTRRGDGWSWSFETLEAASDFADRIGRKINAALLGPADTDVDP